MKKHYLLLAVVVVLGLGLWLSFNVLAQNVAANVAGHIVLNVDSNGEAWYVHPETKERFYMGRPADALEIMQSLGLGITTKSIETVPIGLIAQTGSDKDRDGLIDSLEHAIGSNDQLPDTDADGYTDREEVLNGYSPVTPEAYGVDAALVDRLMGRIILQVEDHGEAWYVDPDKGQRFFLGRPAEAFHVLQTLGIGITSDDLEKIPVSPFSIIPTK